MASRAIALFRHSKNLISCLDNVTCSICLEIYELPHSISCGHIFCKNCLASYSGIVEPACPLCRKPFKSSSISKASDMESKIASSKTICTGCEKEISLLKYRHHQTSCEKLKTKAEGNPPVEFPTTVVKNTAIDAPNRHTFTCPYCGVQNFDTHGLRTHVNEKHMANPEGVVCPICASMPWGDASQTSANFVTHLNLRHKFEYDTLVDFELDDDAALQQAIQASMQES
uniref:Uncharacterized protein n=1 Tax=Strigamia maritima TaxID=126957 RepID=T1JKD4_STRMM